MSNSFPDEWFSVPFEKCLDPLTIAKPKKIFARDYASTGSIPVIDQGQDFIAGWTGDAQAAIRIGLPYIIFGDHTRVFKFVNFPFALGADGTQMLKPKPEFNPRFFFYACQSLSIPNRGYNRHFSVVKEMSVPRPPPDEQLRIAALLLLVQQAIETEARIIATTRELKSAAMAKLFAVGIGGSSQLLGELGQVPAHWSRLPISAFGEVVTGTTPKTSERRYYEGGDIAFLAPGDLGYTTRLYTAAKHITREGLLVSRALPKGSTCFVCIGSSIGKVGVTVDEESSTNQQINAIVPSSSFEPMFVCYLLQYFAKYIASHASPSPVPIMSKGQFQQIELVAPSERSEQREIAEILEAIDASIEAHERELKQLQLLFEYLLGRLMTGEIRVRKLEIDVSSVT